MNKEILFSPGSVIGPPGVRTGWRVIAFIFIGLLMTATAWSVQSDVPVRDLASAVPEWVASAIEGEFPEDVRVWISPESETAHAAWGTVREASVRDLSRWYLARPGRTESDEESLDWRLVQLLIEEGDTWVGQWPVASTESAWRAAIRLRLDDKKLEQVNTAIQTRTRLKRIEQLMLILVAATGTVSIVWLFLVLDHKTRHHFSRRFQSIAVLAWIAMGIAISAIWWWAIR